MPCIRCNGPMGFEWAYGENERVPSMKCVTCGHTEWIDHIPLKTVHKTTLRGKYDRSKRKVHN